MHSFFRHFAMGAGSIVLAPAGQLPPPQLRITLPPYCATQAIARDFQMVGRDLIRAIDKVEHAQQMEFDLERLG